VWSRNGTCTREIIYISFGPNFHLDIICSVKRLAASLSFKKWRLATVCTTYHRLNCYFILSFIFGDDILRFKFILTSNGTHPASHSTGTRVLSSRVKRPAYKADCSFPSTAYVKNAWSYTSTIPCACITWYLVKQQGQLYLFTCTIFMYSYVTHFTTLFQKLRLYTVQMKG
jgi:hypothetical protein